MACVFSLLKPLGIDQQLRVNSDYKKQLEDYLKLPTFNGTLANIQPVAANNSSNNKYQIEHRDSPVQQQYQQRSRPQVPQQQLQYQLAVDQNEIMADRGNQRAGAGAGAGGGGDNRPEEFFNQFGKYETKKDKLKNDLHQEYNDYLTVGFDCLLLVLF